MLVSIYSFFCDSSDEEDEDLSKYKDNPSPKERKRKKHDVKKKVLDFKINQTMILLCI